MTGSNPPATAPPAQGVAHLGHELRAHHWLEKARPTVWRPSEKAFYETDAERQLASGYPSSVIRFDRHIQPIALALQAHAERG